MDVFRLVVSGSLLVVARFLGEKSFDESGRWKEQAMAERDDGTDKLFGHHSHDAVFKKSMRLFEELVLSHLGLDESLRIEETVNPETITIEIEKSIADMFFILSDGTGLHIEFQALVTRKDLYRFCTYNISFMSAYSLSDVRTVVITAQKPKMRGFESSVLSFAPVIVDLSERDAEATLERIREEISLGKNVDRLDLVYLPLYNNRSSTANVLKEAIPLVNACEKDRGIAEQILVLMIVISEKLLTPDEVKEIMEVVHMQMSEHPIMDMIADFYVEKGLKAGLVEGRAEGMKEKEIEMASRALKKGLSSADVAEISGLSLERVEELAMQIA